MCCNAITKKQGNSSQRVHPTNEWACRTLNRLDVLGRSIGIGLCWVRFSTSTRWKYRSRCQCISEAVQTHRWPIWLITHCSHAIDTGRHRHGRWLACWWVKEKEKKRGRKIQELRVERVDYPSQQRKEGPTRSCFTPPSIWLASYPPYYTAGYPWFCRTIMITESYWRLYCSRDT